MLAAEIGSFNPCLISSEGYQSAFAAATPRDELISRLPFTLGKTSAILRRMIFPSKRFLAIALVLFTLRASAADPVAPVRREIDEAVARVKPALVRIQVVATQYYQGREVKYEASGSGVII